jgi:peptide/nickel transport system substrate-binding protein
MPELIRRFWLGRFILFFLLVSCGPQPASATPTGSTPIATRGLHAPEIRFAVVGQATDVNVWALFDETGTSYANYALRNEYWPRLYTLSFPERDFIPQAAKDMPSGVTQEGDFYAVTVHLRDDIKWTDNSGFSAEDIAFTIQTALAFELTFDWRAFYNPDYLDHAEALDANTVKLLFKKRPNVGVLQYGVLQGPVVQKAYWASKVAQAQPLLPDADLHQNISDVLSEIDILNKTIAEINALMPTLRKNGAEYRKADADLRHTQGNLDAANNKLAALQADYASKLKSAREQLFSFVAKDEPTLGIWMPGESQGSTLTNHANPAFPFTKPNFDKAVYRFYADEKDALAAFQNGEVDMVLAPSGISPDSRKSLAGTITANPDSSARFLAFNHSRFIFSNPAFRAALDCVIDRNVLVEKHLQGDASPLESFVLPEAGIWYDPDARSGCSGMDDATRVQTAVSLLKSAGFTWAKEPTRDGSGQGLMTPGGKAYPEVTLLAPSADFDPQRAAAAEYIEGQARLLGIPLTTKLVTSQDVLYAVYSSGDYDLAILGWRLSEYPSYLCTWFEPWGANPFHYNEDKPKSACEAFESAARLEDAEQASFVVQSLYAKEMPILPLYTNLTYDSYRNLKYPFAPLNGLTSLFGAPSFAIPGP